MTAFTGFGQKDSVKKKIDSCICVTPGEMINAIRTSDTLDIAKQEIKALDTLNARLTKDLRKADSVIVKQDVLHLEDKAIIRTKDNIIDTKNQQNLLCLDFNSYLKLQIKAQKRKTTKVVAVATVIISGMAYLLTKK